MSVGRAFYCDASDCDTHTAPVHRAAPYLPYGFLEVRCGAPDGTWQFCSWDCLMKYAAGEPLPERVEVDDG